MHCMIYKKQVEFPEDVHLPADERRKKEVIMVADGRYVCGRPVSIQYEFLCQ